MSLFHNVLAGSVVCSTF